MRKIQLRNGGIYRLACVLLLLLTPFAVFAGGAQEKAVAVETGPAQVVVIQNGDPATLDPQKAGGSVGGNINFNIFDGLTRQSGDMSQVLPGLATEWYAVDDTTWEFKLRKGVKFHNGEPFNAEAVKFTVERMLDPNEANDSSSFKMLVDAIVLDEYTIRLTTSQPDPLLPAKLFGMSIMPPKYTAEVGNEEFGKKPVGTGAFKLGEYVPNQKIVLVANDDYWDGRPEIDELVFRPVAEASTRLAELLSGEADIIMDVSPEDIDTVERENGVHIVTVNSKRVPYIGFDTLPGAPEFLQDVRVRQALNYAVDVDAIIETILSGYGKRLATIYRPDFVGFDPTLKPYSYDPDKALALLKEAGYKPSDITLKIASNDNIIPKGGEVAEAVAGMLQEIGINAEADPQSYQGIRDMYIGGQKTHKGDPLWTWNWGSREPDANSPLTGTLHSKGITSYYKDPVLDAMIEEAARTVDMDARKAIHTKIQHYIYDNATMLFLYDSMDIYGVSESVDWTPRRDQYVLGRQMKMAD